MSTDPVEGQCRKDNVGAEAEVLVDTPDTFDNFYSPYNRRFYEQHRYVDLDATRREIRLLRIDLDDIAQGNSTPIKCELLEGIPLAKAKDKFSAISYCAGDPKETEEIEVNGITFNAFARLGHALRQARWFWKQRYSRTEQPPDDIQTAHKSQQFLLWADQICINQSDPRERSHQVNFMGDIYAAAEHTFISLSEERHRKGGLDWLENLFESLRQEHVTTKEALWQMDLCPECRSGKDAFRSAVVNSPYWQRAWVRQEYVRSRDPHILAAFEVYQRYMIMDEVCELATPSDAGKTMHLKVRTFYRLENIVPPRYALLHYLSLSQSCQASDPRDLFYAYMGLGCHNYGLTVSYAPDVSFADVWCTFTRNVILDDKYLNILALVDPSWGTGITADAPSLPSWTPNWFGDWRRKGTVWVQEQRVLSRPVAQFLADETGKENRVMQVQGLFLGKLCNKTRDSLGRHHISAHLWWLHGYPGVCILKTRPSGVDVTTRPLFPWRNQAKSKQYLFVCTIASTKDTDSESRWLYHHEGLQTVRKAFTIIKTKNLFAKAGTDSSFMETIDIY